jgi:epoxyqueuosine reductase
VNRAATVKRIIREYAWDLGIDGIGSCDAEPLMEAREAYESAILHALIPEESAPHPRTIERLTTPRRHLRGARSILSAFEYYYKNGVRKEDPSRGAIAGYTRANHYLDLKVKLETLASFMAREFGCRTKVFSCYVTLAEKPLALKSGIGFYGKHGVIITPAYGSYVVLGEILTDLDLEPDRPSRSECGECTLCMDKCPTGAIAHPYVLDRGRCIQYISERRGVVPLDIRDSWGNRLYGCSTCQEVCPLNAQLTPTPREVLFGRVGDSIPIAEILAMDDDGFLRRFANNQIGMREPAAIKRNAIVAAGNSEQDSFVPALSLLITDPDPMIRQHGLWALAKIKGPGARAALERSLRGEPNPLVQTEIKSLLDGLGRFA